jgi:hypothetical protein
MFVACTVSNKYLFFCVKKIKSIQLLKNDLALYVQSVISYDLSDFIHWSLSIYRSNATRIRKVLKFKVT